MPAPSHVIWLARKKEPPQGNVKEIVAFQRQHIFRVEKDVISLDILSFETRDTSEHIAAAAMAFSQMNGPARIDKATWPEFSSKHETSLLVRAGVVALGQPTPPPLESEQTASLSDLEMNVAQVCNLACEYCCVGKGEFGETAIRMSREIARSAIDQLLERSLGPTHEITFFGGEPLLNLSVISDILDYATTKANSLGRSVTFRLLTNGTAFSAKAVRQIHAYNVRVQVSIDGPEESNDRWRVDKQGRGTFLRVINAINRYFRSRKDLISIRATLTRGNLNAYRVYFFLKEQGFDRVVVSHANGHFDASHYSAAELEELKSGYTLLAKHFLQSALECESILVVGAPFNEHIRTLAAGDRKSSYCGAGTRFVGLSARGEYYFCQDLAEDHCAKVGDVGSDLQTNQVRAIVNQIAAVDNKPVCSDCWARYVCGGGCGALAASENRDLSRPFFPDCELIRHNIELSAWILRRLQVDCPQAFLDWLTPNHSKAS